jgi:transposase
MMGQQVRAESLFYYFRLEDQIPEDHLLRLIDRHVDLSFVRDRLKNFYSSTGRPSIPKYCCDCCSLAICTDLPVSDVCWKKCG